MRFFAILVAVIASVWLGNFVYIYWLRPTDQPTVELRALEAQFNKAGVHGHLYPVRHGSSHSRVRAVAAFEIKDYPLPFVLIACATETEAAARSQSNPKYPKELQASRNGLVVLEFPTWGDDTFSMAKAVKQAFLSYRSGP